jgi:hypothetical protein
MYSTPGLIRTCTDATTVDSDNCHTWSSCTDATPGTERIEFRTPSSETWDGTACMRMYEADLTARQSVQVGEEDDLPSGMAEEKMMQVMKSDTPGSK